MVKILMIPIETPIIALTPLPSFTEYEADPIPTEILQADSATEADAVPYGKPLVLSVPHTTGQPGMVCHSWFYHPRRQIDCLFSYFYPESRKAFFESLFFDE
jgi:hypothetical protein